MRHQTPRQLCDLPNLENFEFVGIGKEAETYNCIVKKDPVGCHSVCIKETNEPVHFKLAGWRKHETKQP